MDVVETLVAVELAAVADGWDVDFELELPQPATASITTSRPQSFVLCGT